MDVKIKDAPVVDTVTSSIQIPVSDGTNTPKTMTVEQMDSYTKVEARNVYGYPLFSPSTAYAIGAKVIYNGYLYKFTSAHAAGVWDSEDVVSDSIKSEFDAMATNVAEKADTTDIEDGTVVAALAKDLDISSSSGQEYTQTAGTDTTGGSLSIKNGTAELVSFNGTDAGIAAANAIVYSRGFNCVTSTSGQTVTCQVVKGTWGSYGTATANNGYQFTKSDGTVVVPTSVVQNGSAVPIHVESGKNYYIPAASGTMTATFASGVTVSAICCHLCWSNYRDVNNNYETAWVQSINLSSVVTTMGGVLRRVSNSIGNVEDSIGAGKWYRRVGQDTLSGLTWAVSSESVSGTDTYTYTAQISAMLADGIYSISGTSLTITVSGNTLTTVSTTITTVAALQTALGSAYIKYQLATVVSGTHSVNMSSIKVDDFGIIYVGSGTFSVKSTMKYSILWADTLKNMPDLIGNDAEVTAAALNSMNARIAALEDVTDKLGDATANTMNVAKEYQICGKPLVIVGTTAPATAPDSVPQFYVDTANNHFYYSKGTSAATDWQVV